MDGLRRGFCVVGRDGNIWMPHSDRLRFPSLAEYASSFFVFPGSYAPFDADGLLLVGLDWYALKESEVVLWLGRALVKRSL